MEHIKEQISEMLILDPVDYSDDEWNTILKIFNLKEAERVVISDYTFEAFGMKNTPVTPEEWAKAIDYLNTLIIEYASIGMAGRFGLDGVLIPLRKRYESGERTRELYEAIMECE